MLAAVIVFAADCESGVENPSFVEEFLPACAA